MFVNSLLALAFEISSVFLWSCSVDYLLGPGLCAVCEVRVEWM